MKTKIILTALFIAANLLTIAQEVKKVAIIAVYANNSPVKTGESKDKKGEYIYVYPQVALNTAYDEIVKELSKKGISVLPSEKVEAITKKITGVQSAETKNTQEFDKAKQEKQSQPTMDAQQLALEEKIKNLPPEQQDAIRKSMAPSGSSANMQQNITEQYGAMAKNIGKSQDKYDAEKLTKDTYEQKNPGPDLGLGDQKSPLFSKQIYFSCKAYPRNLVSNKKNKNDSDAEDANVKQILQELQKEGADAYIVVEIGFTPVYSFNKSYAACGMYMAVYDMKGKNITYSHVEKNSENLKTETPTAQEMAEKFKESTIPASQAMIEKVKF